MRNIPAKAPFQRRPPYTIDNCRSRASMEGIQSTLARANPTSGIRPRRSGVPCIRCRQMKIKCDASSNFPAPCSGCEKSRERCCIDPLFRRTAIRKQKNNERDAPSHQEVVCNITSVNGSPQDERASSAILDPDVFSLTRTLKTLTANLRSTEDKGKMFASELKLVCLGSSAVADLLEEYYSCYHTQFPLLYDPTEVLDSYQKCPMLFWVVLAISCKHHDTHAGLYSVLQDLINTLMANTIILGTRSIYLVQAFLLLYVWSFPRDDMNKEPSSTYCALGISMAKSLGLHRPQHPFRFFSAKNVEIGDLESRTRTWLACFIMDQWHTARFGVPATLRADHTVIYALNNSSAVLPGDMYSQLHIAYVTSKISTVLGECESTSTGLLKAPLSLVQMFDTELSILQEKYSQAWSCATEISLLDARLSLYCYVLAQDRSSISESPCSDAVYVPLGSSTAMQLLNIFSTFHRELIKGMFHTFRSVSYAVFFLLRIIGTANQDSIDETAIRNSIAQAWGLIREFSCIENREWSKMCKTVVLIIEHMSNYEHWDQETPLIGPAKSFMGNNFIADVAARGVVKAREKYMSENVRQNVEDSAIFDAPDWEMNFMWENIYLSDEPLQW